MHSVISLIYSQMLEVSYVIFVVLVGFSVSYYAKYAVMMLEQRQLIK